MQLEFSIYSQQVNKSTLEWSSNQSNESDISTNENFDSQNSLQNSTKISQKEKFKSVFAKLDQKEVSRLSLEDITEIEQEKLNDPQAISFYIHDIIYNLLQKEQSFYALSPKTYPLVFPLNSFAYGLIIDWLRDLTCCLQLTLETFYLSISIFQRYIAKQQKINNQELQLLGLSAFFIACKYQEIAPPSIKELLYLVNNQYEEDEVYRIENEILSVIEFQFLLPTVYDFINYYVSQAGLTPRDEHLVHYIIELSLLEIQMAKLYYPSQIALASIYLVKKLRKLELNLQQNETQRFNELEIKLCAKDLCHIMQNIKNSQFQTMRNIYSQEEFCGVAKISLVPTQKINIENN